ncbi:MAG: glycine oxidase ThiO [Chloroflexi bacterium]|nr:glycine oxidase ThiO [Chloroflexota bacterium]
MTSADRADVVIVGGGVVGCCIAYYLTLGGARVTLLERAHLAAGASGVAAGMLAPQVEAPFADPFFELCLLGRAEHAPLAAALLEDVGLDVEYRQTGILRVARTESERVDLQRMWRWQSARGLAAEWVDSDDLGTCEPLLRGVAGRLLAGALWLADEGQVRGPRLVQALAMAAAQRGARFVEGTPVVDIARQGERVSGVQTPTEVIESDTVVLAAGVWSPDLGRRIGLDLPVAPVKGQILSLRGLGKTPRRVIWCGECYLVPRPDGEVVLGATEEEGNYDARPTLAGVNRLTEAALEVVPAVGSFSIDGFWAGLRPAAPDRFPLVGWAPGLEGLFVATAHYRNGVLLGPLTGRRVAEDILHGSGLGELAPFGPERFDSSWNAGPSVTDR